MVCEMNHLLTRGVEWPRKCYTRVKARRGEIKAIAALTAKGVGTCGADDNQAQAGHVIETSSGAISHCLNAGGMGRLDYETETMVVHGCQDPGVNHNLAHTLGRNSGQENAVCATGEVTHTLRADGFDRSEDGTGGGQPIVSVSLRGRSGGATAEFGDDVGNTLRASSGGADKAHALIASSVRRLTAIECERLQGFPDNYTRIPWRHMPAGECPDGPRYKAIGNSKAVTVVRWIGRRIRAQL
jgi:DNA (cytosine-5)-methyltransferase 1